MNAYRSLQTIEAEQYLGTPIAGVTCEATNIDPNVAERAVMAAGCDSSRKHLPHVHTQAIGGMNVLKVGDWIFPVRGGPFGVASDKTFRQSWEVESATELTTAEREARWNGPEPTGYLQKDGSTSAVPASVSGRPLQPSVESVHGVWRQGPTADYPVPTAVQDGVVVAPAPVWGAEPVIPLHGTPEMKFPAGTQPYGTIDPRLPGENRPYGNTDPRFPADNQPNVASGPGFPADSQPHVIPGPGFPAEPVLTEEQRRHASGLAVDEPETQEAREALENPAHFTE